MAQFEGTQSIPSELLDLYRATLTEGMPTGVIRKRFPYRLRLFQKGGYKVTDEQLKQRSRFEAIIEKFKSISDEDRARWYDARPPWSSLLWYYNYFMLSGLMGNAVVGDKGGGVIKNIKHYTFTLPAGNPVNVTVNIDTCDPKKAIAFLFGNGANEQNPGENVYYAVPVYPYLVTLASTYAVFKASMPISWDAGCSVSIIEYI
jgi:hypothetical protein